MYIFDHIFKTAGTTFVAYLTAAFSPSEIFVVNGFRDENERDLQCLAALPEEQKAQFKVIAGHNAGRLRSCFPDAKFLTLVRDPVDRAVSGYLHAKHHGDAWESVGHLIAERDMGIAEFIREDVFAREYAPFHSFHDWQAKTVLEAFTAPPADGDIAAIAKSRFRVIGVTDQFEKFLMCLHLAEGFPLAMFHNRLVRKERQEFQLDAEGLAAIEQNSHMDRLVYEVVRREFDLALLKVWDSDAESRYREYLSGLRLFQSSGTT